MIVDIEELKRKALAAQKSGDEAGERWPTDDDYLEFPAGGAETEYVRAASPAAVIALFGLLAESEQIALRLSELAEQIAYRMVAAERDAARYRWVRSRPNLTLVFVDRQPEHIDAAVDGFMERDLS